MNEQVAKELSFLSRILRNGRFRFIVVTFNHFDLVRDTQQHLAKTYPDRASIKVDVSKTDYRSLMDQIETLGTGICYLERFHELKDFPELAIPFNQRRDKLAQLDIAFIAFVYPEEQILTILERSVPDLWSLRSGILDLEKEIEPFMYQYFEDYRNIPLILVNFFNKDYEKLTSMFYEIMEETPEKNSAIRATLFEDLALYYQANGHYEMTINLVDEFEQHSNNQENDLLLSKKVKIQTLFILQRYDAIKKLLIPHAKLYSQTSLSEYEIEILILLTEYNILTNKDQNSFFYTKTKSIILNYFKKNTPLVYRIKLLIQLGILAYKVQNFQEAVDFYEKAYELIDMKKSIITVVHIVTLLGFANEARGNHKTAFTLFKLLPPKSLKSIPVEIGIIHTNLAFFLQGLGDKERAIEHFQKALSIFQSKMDEDFPHIATIKKHLNALGVEEDISS